MEYCIHSIRTILALLTVAVAATIGGGAPVLAHSATGNANGTPRHANDEKERITIRKANDHGLKAGEPLYPQQAKSLARQYRDTARIVAGQGGNPKPILDAAAYFESQAELTSRVNAP